jgi:30S ribosomal protein S31
MGKGDQRSRRGKIHRGTFGKRRPKPKRLRHGAASSATAEAAQTTKSKEAKVVKKQPAEATS